jgi:hypothetical protein
MTSYARLRLHRTTAITSWTLRRGSSGAGMDGDDMDVSLRRSW